MAVEVVVSIVAALGAIAAAIASGTFAWRAAQVPLKLREEERRVEYDAAVARYRIPLLHAAYDLQSRLWNMVCKEFVKDHVDRRIRHQSYIVDDSLFVICQFFCWMEIIRREIQYFDIGDDTRDFLTSRNRLYFLWQTREFDEAFMVWAGEQRAIGESMIVERPHGSDCMGYAQFLDSIEKGLIPWLGSLRSDIEQMATDTRHGYRRLIEIQAVLIELLELLDPKYEFFPIDERSLATDYLSR